MFQNKKGFILLNTLVAIIFFIVVVAISMPYIRNYRINSELSAEARKIVSELKYTGQRSVTEQVVYGIFFDETNDSYQVIKVDGATSTIKTLFLENSINIKQVNGLSGDQVRFNFYGGVSDSGEIILESVLGKEIIIEIKPSGYVKIQ
jgi:Tfp pilus assembly major pilin PilA